MPSPCGFDQLLVSGASGNFDDYNGVYTWNDGIPNAYPNGAFIKNFPDNSRVVIHIALGELFGGKWNIYKNLPNFIAVETVNCPTDVINWTNPYGVPGTPPTSIVQYKELNPVIITDAKAAGVRIRN
jgi:hypothetical protein